jgi:hypothetical protein
MTFVDFLGSDLAFRHVVLCVPEVGDHTWHTASANLIPPCCDLMRHADSNDAATIAVRTHADMRVGG